MAELEALPQVQSVEVLDGQRFRLHLTAAENPAPAIAQQAVAKDWGLLELTPQRRTLEEIFVQITSGEHGAVHQSDTHQGDTEEHAA